MIGVAADVSIDEAKLIIRRLQLDAYFCLVNAFRASGYLTKTKLRILQDLSVYFQLSTERHQAEIRRAVNDEELTALADLVTKDDSSYEWICEGRHPIPMHSEDMSYKLPRNVKLRKEPAKTDKVKDRKPASVLPTVAAPNNLTKATQTLTIKSEIEEGGPEEERETSSPEINLTSLLSRTPDILEAVELEKMTEEVGESLLVYLPLENNKPGPTDDMLPIPTLPTLIPIRLGEEIGKMIAEQCKAIKDQTGHVQLPLDLAKLTKDRLEKKARQRQRRANSAVPEGAIGPQFKRRRKKGATPNVSETTLHGLPDHVTHGELGPTLTTPEPPSEHQLGKDILVKVGSSQLPTPGPPLLTKAPPNDLSPSYHGLQPPTLQRMPGAPNSGAMVAHQSPVKSSYPALPISPAKSYPQIVKTPSPMTSGMLKFRSGQEQMDSRASADLKTPDVMSPDQHHSAQKQWAAASRSEAAWQELSRSEPNSIQVQRHYNQQHTSDKRKYSAGQEQLMTREHWIAEHMHQSAKAHREGEMTPEKVMQENQRYKMGDIEDRRAEETEKRKEEERQRIEERLKMDERHRQEEKRAHHNMVKHDQKIVKVDQSKIVKLDQKMAGKEDKSFGKQHDPTTSYLSTYMPKQANQGKGPSRQTSVTGSCASTSSKHGRSKGKPTEMTLVTQQPGHIPPQEYHKQESSRIEVSKSVRIESIPQGVPTSVPAPSPKSEMPRSEKKDERIIVKPTIQILTQTPAKMSTMPQQHEYKAREMQPHARDHAMPPGGRDVIQLPRDSRDYPHQSRDMSRDSAKDALSGGGKGEQYRKSEGTESKEPAVSSSKLSTTAPTICVRAVSSKPPASQSKSYLPYSSKVSSQEMQMANLYTQQVLQHQLAFMQHQQQGNPMRTNMALYKGVNPSGGNMPPGSKDTVAKLTSPAEMPGVPRNSVFAAPDKIPDKMDAAQRQLLSEKERQDQQRQITDQQRQVVLQQPGYRVSPSGQVLVGKFTGSNFDPMSTPGQYQLTMSVAGNAPPQPTPSKNRTVSETSSSSAGGRKSGKTASNFPVTATPVTAAPKQYTPYMQAQLTKPHSTVPEGRSRKLGSGVPEDVFNFPDDDEERNSLRRAEERQKQLSRGVERREKEVERPLSFQQKQQLHSKMIHERQMMELRAIHERKVEEEIKRFEEEFCKNIHKMAGEASAAQSAQLQPEQHHAVSMQSSAPPPPHTVMTSSVTTVQSDRRSGVEVQHYLQDQGRPAYPGHGLTITTPHLTLPASSGHLVTSSGIIITHPQSSSSSSFEGGEDYQKRSKRKMGGQDYINSLLKSALSLLQKTLKIRPKTRLVNPSYPPHIWHQQSMDPKFVEKGLTPIDLMTVKKKLEFGEYPSFEAFYNDVTHFQNNYSEVYPSENQLRQEIDEIMGVFLKELKEIYRSVPPHQGGGHSSSTSTGSTSSKKQKSDPNSGHSQ